MSPLLRGPASRPRSLSTHPLLGALRWSGPTPEEERLRPGAPPQSDGKILALDYDRVTRLDRYGGLDTSFGRGQGWVRTITDDVTDDVSNYAVALAVRPTGEIVVAGSSHIVNTGDFAVTQLTSTGDMDPNFGNGDGIVYTDVVFDWVKNDHATCAALMQDGRFVVAGWTERGSWDDFGIVRYHPNGNLDRECYDPDADSENEDPGVVARTIPSFQRGDASGDGGVDITDVIYTLNFLFAKRDEPTCLKALDADDSGEIELTDASFAINFLFLGGTLLPEPAGSCGVDPSADSLSCASGGSCNVGGPIPTTPAPGSVVR